MYIYTKYFHTINIKNMESWDGGFYMPLFFLIYRVCTRNTNMNMAETTGKFAGLQKLSVPT